MSMPSIRWSLLAALGGALLLAEPAPHAGTVKRGVLAPDPTFHVPDSVRAYLSAVTRIVVAPDSSLYLSDMRIPAILHLEPSGDYRRVIGNAGGGPGEFYQVFMVGLYRDSLWAMDPAHVRVTLFPLNGSGQRTLPYGPYAPKSTAPGAYSKRGRPASILPDGSFLLEEGTPDPTRPTNRLLLRADRFMRVLDTITPLPASRSSMVFLHRDGAVHLTQPYSDDPLYGVAGDGSLVVLVTRPAAANEEGAEFTVVGLQGGDREVFRRTIQYQPRRLSQKAVEGVVKRLVGENEPGMPRSPVTTDSVWRRLYRPKFYPPISQVVVGRDGSTWLKVQFGDGPAKADEWMQLSARGLPLRRVTVPEGFRLLEADRRQVWGALLDSMDVPEVKRYTLDRSFAN